MLTNLFSFWYTLRLAPKWHRTLLGFIIKMLENVLRESWEKTRESEVGHLQYLGDRLKKLSFLHISHELRRGTSHSQPSGSLYWLLSEILRWGLFFFFNCTLIEFAVNSAL